MKRAALYVRQSLDVKEGIDRQIDKCKSLVKLREWDIVEIFEDNDVSASKPRGPGTAWARMLEAASNDEFDVLVAVNLDRLIRNQKDLLTLIELNKGITTIEQDIDLTTPAGKMTATVLTAMAEFEVKRKAERLIRANDFRAKHGIPTSGRRVYGWEKDRITLIESEAKIVREMTQAVISGKSIHSIVRDLNSRKIPTVTGKTWSSIQVKRVLLRERNAGQLVRYGVVQEKSTIKPIVSQKDYELVVALLQKPGRGETKGPKPEINWLGGLMTCGVCGNPMWAKNVTAKGVRKRNYMCSTRVTRAHNDEKRHVTIDAILAESKMELFLYGQFSAEAGTNKKPSFKSEKHKKHIENVQRKLTEAQAKRIKVQELAVLAGADLDWVSHELQNLGREIESLAAERADLLVQNTSGDEIAKLIAKQKHDTSETAEAWLEYWNSVPIEVRRKAIQERYTIEVLKGGKGPKRLKIETKLLGI